MIKRRNLVSGSFFVLLGVFLYVAAGDVAENPFADPNAMDIMLYPRILIYIWTGASVIYALSPRDRHDWAALWNARVPLIKACLAIAFYMAAFAWLGLFLSTTLFMLLFLWWMEYREGWKMIVISLSCGALAWFIFEFLLGIVMPRGIFMDVFAG